MFKIMNSYVLGFISLFSMYGCGLLVAGAVGGVGTAAWLNDKLIQEVRAPFEKSVEASRLALKDLNMPITRETIEPSVAQLRSERNDEPVWIDIHRFTTTTTRIEVRAGVPANKQEAQRILDKILANL